MKAIQTLELTDREVKIVTDFFNIIDGISDVTDTPIEGVISYFCEAIDYDLDEDNCKEFIVDKLHDIRDIRSYKSQD